MATRYKGFPIAHPCEAALGACCDGFLATHLLNSGTTPGRTSSSEANKTATTSPSGSSWFLSVPQLPNHASHKKDGFPQHLRHDDLNSYPSSVCVLLVLVRPLLTITAFLSAQQHVMNLQGVPLPPICLAVGPA